MDNTSLFFNIIFGLLLLALIITFLKYPLQILKGILYMFIPDWARSNNLNKSEEPYPSRKNLRFNFSTGTKLLFLNADEKSISELIKDFTEWSEGSFLTEDFKFKQNNLIECPNQISYYDFNLLTQHFCNRFKDSRGIFNSTELSYFLYQDPNSVHNLIGQTNDGQKFSIYTLDDLNKKVYLKINNQLTVNSFELAE
jgi:hypothetical protein